ncbi:MAG: urease accessory protein UreF [Candidatus Methylumidiphilus sp.]
MGINLGLLRLLQLVSPSLPVGMYSYSQGMEQAVENAWITGEAQVRDWLAGILRHSLATLDAPLLALLYDAWALDDMAAVEQWSGELAAMRETAELRAEDAQTGQALARVLDGLGVARAKPWLRHRQATFAALFALAAVEWAIPKPQAVAGYLWSWLENQVLCAVKLVPLGQLAGQRLLHGLALEIPALAEAALVLPPEAIGSSGFALALASSRHERQYSRLFRS